MINVNYGLFKQAGFITNGWMLVYFKQTVKITAVSSDKMTNEPFLCKKMEANINAALFTLCALYFDNSRIMCQRSPRTEVFRPMAS